MTKCKALTGSAVKELRLSKVRARTGQTDRRTDTIPAAFACGKNTEMVTVCLGAEPVYAVF